MNSDSDTPIDLTVANSPSQEDSTEIAQINRDSFDRNIKMTPAKKKKVSKPSVLPTFLPPCRVCNAKASGFHYGGTLNLRQSRWAHIAYFGVRSFMYVCEKEEREIMCARFTTGTKLRRLIGLIVWRK